MRHALISPALIFFQGITFAQSWCPPGATWTYTYSNGWTTEGYARFTYIGDTIISSLPTQVIAMHTEGTEFGSPFTHDYDPYFTTVDADLVSIWTVAGFDTLYFFGAAPGDHWELTAEDGGQSQVQVIVSDTGTTIVGGLSLHFLVLGNDTIVQRFGSLYQFMLPWINFTTDAAGGPLRCYSDVDISYSALWWGYGCSSFMGASEQTSVVKDVFPNPGTDDFTMQLPSGYHAITMRDALGRLVLTQNVAGGTTVVDASSFAPGAYMVTCIAANGTRSGSIWMKE
ncbi:MAG: T9SS type A sorting domain-containing protein [Flavobacteriales bacterium]